MSMPTNNIWNMLEQNKIKNPETKPKTKSIMLLIWSLLN